MRVNHKRKTTVSMKMFIEEFGEAFSEHQKERLMELDLRCVLTRREFNHIFDLKHVEHTKYNSEGKEGIGAKEPIYAQLAVVDDILYFSEGCTEDDKFIKSPAIKNIYDFLDSKENISDEGINFKRVDDSNIDFVVNSLLSSCPEVSARYISIVREMMSLSESK